MINRFDEKSREEIGLKQQANAHKAGPAFFTHSRTHRSKAYHRGEERREEVGWDDHDTESQDEKERL